MNFVANSKEDYFYGKENKNHFSVFLSESIWQFRFFDIYLPP